MSVLDLPAWVKKTGMTALALKYYPTAKKGLIKSGRTVKEVEEMPTLQVVALYQLEQYDQARDEILQWILVPGWQGREPLKKVEANARARGREKSNLFIVLQSMLVPAIVKVYSAQLRQGRNIAGFRGAEALRLHVATTGKAPAKWSDITLPGPIDPFTGKGLDAWYKLTKDKATLDIPAPPEMPVSLARHYEMAVKVAEGEK
jgi:hypothetical protein